jgi:hypothetical protein
MRSKFDGFYPPTEADLKDLWANGVFILDANVLLNLYRYSEETRKQLVALFADLKPRLWLPHQAALEFHENRLDVITSQHRQYDAVIADFKRIVELLEATRTHPFVKKDTLSKLKGVLAETEKELASSKQQLAALEMNDPISDQLTKIFEGRVGDPLSSEVMAALPVEGEDRYKRGIPPGFEDRKKPDARRYGDLIMWKQILIFASSNKVPLLFITDDAKEDWWRRHAGKTIGPLPALKEEVQFASGRAFHMYRPDRFLHYASEHLKKPLKKETLTEVTESQRRNEELARVLMENALRASENRRMMEEALRPAIERQRMMEELRAGAKTGRRPETPTSEQHPPPRAQRDNPPDAKPPNT